MFTLTILFHCIMMIDKQIEGRAVMYKFLEGLIYGGIHKRRTHARGEGEFAKSVRKVYKGEGGFKIVNVHIFEDVRASDFFRS